MDLRTLEDSDRERVSSSNLLACHRLSAGDLHTVQDANESGQRAITSDMLPTRCLAASTTVVAIEIPKINRLRGELLNGRCPGDDVQYNGMSHRSSYKHMQWIKYGAAADVCTNTWDLRSFIAITMH